MSLDEFLSRLKDRTLSEPQLTNLQKINEISRKFHKEAESLSQRKRLTTTASSSNQDINPITSPTPEPGFLLEFLQQKLKNSIALFGFADQKRGYVLFYLLYFK